LFNPQSGPTWSTEDDHLAKMMEIIGESFDETMLSVSQNRDKYFDKDGQYTSVTSLLPSDQFNASFIQENFYASMSCFLYPSRRL
jgi:hypothetical protein